MSIFIKNKSTEYAKLKEYSENLELFAKECIRISHPIKGTIPFLFNSYQQFFDKRINESKKGDYLLSMRQVGKTTFLAAFVLHNLLFVENTSIMYIGTSFTNGKYFLEKLKMQYKLLPDFIKEVIPIETDRLDKFALENGSIIKVCPARADTFRGETANIVIFDEADYVKDFEYLFETASTPKSTEAYSQYFYDKELNNGK